MNTCGGTIRDTTIRQNYTDDSTIRVADGAGSPIAVITNCTIMSNIFAFIGCVYFAVPARLEHCDIMYNESTSADDGVNIPVSAIYIASIGSAKSIIRNCRIMNNSAASAVNNGMAVWIASNAVIENCLISGHDKGGVRTGTNAYGMILSSCTIANNTKYGVYMNTDAGYTNAVTNYIIYTNGTADITNKVEACTNFFWYCCASNPLPASQGNIASDPLFEGISTNNYRLAAGSPCINRGINLPWMINDVDLDGKKRIMMRNVDIGAYEAWPPSGTIFYGR